jgi:hypothetical protein
MEKRDPCTLLVLMQASTTIMKIVQRFFYKLKIELPYVSQILLLDIFQKLKSIYQNDIRTPTFISALFTIVKIWKQPECPLPEELIKNKCGAYTQWNTYCTAI